LPGPLPGGEREEDRSLRLFVPSPRIIQRKRRPRNRPERQAQERTFRVIARDAVGFDLAAARAAVDDGPFAVGFGFDGDGLHGASASAGAVAGVLVDVPAVEARGAVVAVFGAPALGG